MGKKDRHVELSKLSIEISALILKKAKTEAEGLTIAFHILNAFQTASAISCFNKFQHKKKKDSMGSQS